MDYGKYFPILKYYEKVVIPINPRRYHVKGEKMMVCPLHDDHDPSMGVVHSSKSGEIFHCFGCNRWGNVVELHQGVVKRLKGRYISYDESLRDLCRIFDVNYAQIKDMEERESEGSEVKREMALEEAMDRFDISDFKELFLQGKLSGRGVGYFNNLMMVMVNEIKEKEKE